MAGCFSLKSTCIVVALIDMVGATLVGIFSVMYVGTQIGSLAGMLSGDGISVSMRAEFGQAIGLLVGLGIGILVLCFVKFYIGLTLMRGAEQDDCNKCMLCFIASCVFLSLNMVGSVLYSTDWAAAIISTIYQLSCILLVFAFMRQLKLKAKLAPVGDEKPIMKGGFENV